MAISYPNQFILTVSYCSHFKVLDDHGLGLKWQGSNWHTWLNHVSSMIITGLKSVRTWSQIMVLPWLYHGLSMSFSAGLCFIFRNLNKLLTRSHSEDVPPEVSAGTKKLSGTLNSLKTYPEYPFRPSFGTLNSKYNLHVFIWNQNKASYIQQFMHCVLDVYAISASTQIFGHPCN